MWGRTRRSMTTTTLQEKGQQQPRLVVVLTGPTAVGKSDVAAKLCQQLLSGVIISADSVQAAKGVQIGANKPSQHELQRTPHLLVDYVDAQETYNAAEWQRDALYCIQHLLDPSSSSNYDTSLSSTPRQEQLRAQIQAARQRHESSSSCTPVVVGGTMMYLQWLLHGRPDAVCPTAKALQRAQQDMDKLQLLQESWDDMIRHTAQALGEPYGQQLRKLSSNDWYRLRRILEVAYTLQEQPSSQQQQVVYSGERLGGLLLDGNDSLCDDVRCFCLCPDDRKLQARTTDARCEQMLVRGLLEETSRLAVTAQLFDMAQKAIGYRQALDYLGRPNAVDGDLPALDQFVNDFQAATRRYAKRQMQWFRKDNAFVFVPVSLQSKRRVEEAANEIWRYLSLSREEFDRERLDTSATTPNRKSRLANEQQGKTMRTFLSQRSILLPDSDILQKVLQQADECTKQYQTFTQESQQQQQQRTQNGVKTASHTEI